MNDNDVDQLLTRRGEIWRATNADRPAVDWTQLPETSSRRSWLAVAGVAVAAAAVIVPLTITAGGSANRTDRPSVPGTQPLLDPGVAKKGAPDGFFSLADDGGVSFTRGALTGSIRPSHTHEVALGVRSDRQAWAAEPQGRCRTRLDRITRSPRKQGVGLIQYRRSLTVRGSVASAPMAISPDGQRLALVVAHSPQQFDGSGPCSTAGSGVRAVEVVELATGAVRVWVLSQTSIVTGMQWADDGHVLASIGPACRSCGSGYGTKLIDAVGSPPDTGLDGFDNVVPYGPGNGATPYGAVFMWHRRLAALYGQNLYFIDSHGNEAGLAATNFPLGVTAVSSDSTGNHLLLTTVAKAYRWDRGVVTAFNDQPRQLGW